MNPQSLLNKMVDDNQVCSEAEASRWLKRNNIKTMEEAWQKCQNDTWMLIAMDYVFYNNLYKSNKRKCLLLNAIEWYQENIEISFISKLSVKKWSRENIESTFISKLSVKKGANRLRNSVKNPFKGI